MIYKDLPCIIKSSQNILHKFWLDSSNNLIIEKFDEFDTKNNTRFTYKHSVLDYSVDIDDMDRIHIAFLTKDGVLKHSILDSPSIEKTITSVPSKDYKINYITIKSISSGIHVFYMIQNKYNINKCTINHSFLHNDVWSFKKLDETLFINDSLPYSIDSYKNNIYIFYLTNTPNQYCIQRFNIPFSTWTMLENNISLENCQNAELFINNIGIGIICYNSYINKTVNTILKFKDFNASSSIWSDNLLIRNNSFTSSLPSVLCMNDALFLFWRENDTLFLVKSYYETTNLCDKKMISYKDTIFIGKYISNRNLQYTGKSNFLFLISMTPFYTILEDSDVKNFLKVDTVKTEQKFNPLNGPLRETLKIIAENSNLNNKTLYRNDENDEKIQQEEELDNLVNQQNEFIDSNNLNFDYLKNSLNLKENEIKQLKNNLSLKDAEIEQFKSSLCLKESEIHDLSESYSSMKNLAAEKALLIQDLYHKIQALELQNESIKSSQIQKKKSFIDLFKKDQ